MIQYLKLCASLPTQTIGESALLFVAICNFLSVSVVCSHYLGQYTVPLLEVLCDNPGCEGGLGKNWENLMPAWLAPFMQEKVIYNNTLVLVAMKCCVM